MHERFGTKSCFVQLIGSIWSFTMEILRNESKIERYNNNSLNCNKYEFRKIEVMIYLSNLLLIASISLLETWRKVQSWSIGVKWIMLGMADHISCEIWNDLKMNTHFTFLFLLQLQYFVHCYIVVVIVIIICQFKRKDEGYRIDIRKGWERYWTPPHREQQA